MYGISVITEPSVEPLTTDEVKRHLNLATAVTIHDTYIGTLITAARKFCEQSTNRSFITTTWKLSIDRFPGNTLALFLPNSPLQSVNSIKYIDLSGNQQTWSSALYVVSPDREPGRVSLGYQVIWPYARYQADSIQIEYVAGYGDTAADVPQSLKQAMLLVIGHWFEHRESVALGDLKTVPMAAQALLNSYLVGDEFTQYANDFTGSNAWLY